MGTLCYDLCMSLELMLLLAQITLITLVLFLARHSVSRLTGWVITLLSMSAAISAAMMVDSLMSLIICLMFVWAFISNARLLSHRRRAAALTAIVRRDWLVFLALALPLAVLSVLFDDKSSIIFISIISVATAGLMLLFSIYHAARYRLNIDVSETLPLENQPTVTLAYPARNETHALDATLHSAIDSKYGKLEIIAIDDCSQDKTPQIIRDYAHDGVRFIEGSAPSDGWLGKNAAYRALAEESSGDYILFSGVDVRLSPDSIDLLLSYAVKNDLDMLSIMPQRVNFDFLANFLQTTRYYFQYVLPWELLPISPVLSSLWLIKRDSLASLGGFEAVPNMVVPERYFANTLDKIGKYSFIVSDPNLGVTTRKKTSSQLETATRTLYPMFGESPIVILIISLILLLVMATPFVLGLMAVLGIETVAIEISLISIALFTLSNLVVYTRFNAYSWFIGIFNFPFIVILEAGLLQLSMIKYEFSSVIWKNRNICIPVLNPPLKRQR